MFSKMKRMVSLLYRIIKVLDTLITKNYNFSMLNFSLRRGFTLAEVLITLAIIGIVVAIAIPTVVQKVGDMQNKTLWKKKYSEVVQAYTEVIQNNYNMCVNNSGDYNIATKCHYVGDGRSAARTTLSPEFVNAMAKHFKYVNSCGFPQYGEAEYCSYYYHKWTGLCGGAATYSFYGSLISGSINEDDLPTRPTNCGSQVGVYTGWDFNKKALLLQDGAVVYFGGHAAPMITVDVNGFQKGPNILGKDLFAIMLNENWIRALGAEGTFNKAANGDTCECGKEYGVERGQGFLGSSDLLNGTQVSGACCSYKYIVEK